MKGVGADRFRDPPDDFDDYERRAVRFCKAFGTDINDYLDMMHEFKLRLETYGLDSVEDALNVAYPTRKEWERI